MIKVSYVNTMPFEYVPSHARAPYLIGNAFKNHGEFLESVAKHARGLDYLVNPATRWDNGSDIESLHASVKSSAASLASIYGSDFNAILDIYFNKVASNLWIFIIDHGEEITEYHMNAAEFREFLENWAGLGKESGTDLLKVRIKKVSSKMETWLDARVK